MALPDRPGEDIVRLMLFCAGAGMGLLATIVPAFAHAPILYCYVEDDTHILCEAGYSDGSSALGQEIRVSNLEGRVLLVDKFGDDNTFTFETPDEPYQVEFIGDPGHLATVYSDDIE